MDKYLSWWYSKVNDGQPKLFITDSSNTHLNEEIIRLMRNERAVVAVIPKGCTMYIQSLDVHVFSTFCKILSENSLVPILLINIKIKTSDPKEGVV